MNIFNKILFAKITINIFLNKWIRIDDPKKLHKFRGKTFKKLDIIFYKNIILVKW